MLSYNSLGKINKKQVDHTVIREQINKLSDQIKFEEGKLQVTRYLLEYNIKSYNDIKLINSEKVKNFLEENKYIIYHKFLQIMPYNVHQIIDNYIHIFPPNITTNINIKEIQKERREYRQEFTEEEKIENLEYIRKLAFDNKIPKPKENDLRILKGSEWSYYLQGILLKNYQSYASSQKNSMEFYKRVTEYYHSTITELERNIYETSQLLNSLEQTLRKEYKGQATYNTVFKGVLKKQSGTLLELKGRQEEGELLADLIMNDNDLSKDQKLEALHNIKKEDMGYEIDRWLGKKLSKQERRILRVLRRIIYQMIEQEEITGIGKSIYEAEIPLSRIYQEYGLEKRKCGSYDHNQTKIIQDILFGFSTKGLHEDILFKHNQIQKTRFILQIQEIKQKVIISKEKGKEIEPREVEQRMGIRIVTPHFLFVSDTNLKNYYYQDTEGFKRFMTTTGIAKSESAFNVAEYLEWFLSSKLKERSLDLDTLLEEGGYTLSERYKTHKKKVFETLEFIFNNMVKAKYLIKEWHLGKGKYEQVQYTFKNLRYELFIAGKSKCEVTNLLSNKTTKSKIDNTK